MLSDRRLDYRPRPGVDPIRLAIVVMSLFLASGARSDTLFSIDADSVIFPVVSNNDLLGPGPIGGLPGVVKPFLGLLAGLPDELDAVTAFASSGGPLFFSVDRLSVGVPGAAVFSESFVSQVAADERRRS